MYKKTADAKNIFIFSLVGLVLGGILSNYASNIKYLEWLKIGSTIGMDNPVNINLAVIHLTFGIRFDMYIGSIIGLIIALVLYRRLIR